MNNSATNLETKVTAFLENMEYASQEASRLHNMYFKTDATTNISALSLDSDPATVDSRLTKAEFVSGITMLGELVDFFGNAAVTQGDYMATMQNIMYGNNPIGTQLSYAVEEIGTGMKNFSTNLWDYFNSAVVILDLYNDMKIGTVLASLSNEDIFWGTNLTKSDISSFVTITENFKKFVNNESVTQGDYQSTISKRPR